MIRRDLRLLVSDRSSSLSEPLFIYKYDRGISLSIEVIENDYLFGTVQEDIFTVNDIKKAKTRIKTPDGRVFSQPEIETVIENNIVTVNITPDMTDEMTEVGEYELQIHLYDNENGRITLHPFSFRVLDLIAESGYFDFDSGDNTTPPENEELVTPLKDGDKITATYLNYLEDMLKTIYNTDYTAHNTVLPSVFNQDFSVVEAINYLLERYSEALYRYHYLTTLLRPQQRMFNLGGGIRMMSAAPSVMSLSVEDPSALSEGDDMIETYAGTMINLLSPKTKNLQVGDTFYVRYNINGTTHHPKKWDVKWTSSNPNVVRVNSTGKVLAKANGTSDVTVTMLDGSSSATIRFVVGEDIRIADFDISISNLTLSLKDRYELKIKHIYPYNVTNCKFVFDSSDPESVSVISGENSCILETLKPGSTVTISVTDTVSGIVKYCNVNTIDATSPVYPSNILITPSTYNMELGQTITLAKHFLPDYTTRKNCKWSSSDKNVAWVDKHGIVHPVALGKCVITCTSIYGEEYYDKIGIPTPYGSCSINVVEEGQGDGEQTGPGEDATNLYIKIIDPPSTLVQGSEYQFQIETNIEDLNDIRWVTDSSEVMYIDPTTGAARVDSFGYVKVVCYYSKNPNVKDSIEILCEELIPPYLTLTYDKVYGYLGDILGTDSPILGRTYEKYYLFERSYDLNTWSVIKKDELFDYDYEKVHIRPIEDIYYPDVIPDLFSGLFRRTGIKTFDSSNFNVDSLLFAKNFSGMFDGCRSLVSINLEQFKPAGLNNVSDMFCGCESLTEILNMETWNFEWSIDMSSMFHGCSSLTELDLDGWTFEMSITDCSYMFYGCSALTNLSFSNFNTSLTKNAAGMFANCTNLENIDTVPLSLSAVTNISDMFSGCRKLKTIDINNIKSVLITDTSGMFNDCISLTEIDLSEFTTYIVEDMNGMFSNCISLTHLDLSNFNTSNVTDMSDMFYGCSALINLNVSNFITSKVTDMSGMFHLDSLLFPVYEMIDYSALTHLDLSNFDTSKVTDMSGMFSGCTSLTELDLSNFDTSKVTDMSFMFNTCSSLTELDLSNFDTSKVTDMSYMFKGQDSYNTVNLNAKSLLKKLDLSNFDTSNVTNMDGMFENCESLVELNVPNWNVNNVTDMGHIFENCSSIEILDLSTWKVKNLTDLEYAFNGCSAKYINISNWNLSENDMKMAHIFDDCKAKFLFMDNFKFPASYNLGGYLEFDLKNLEIITMNGISFEDQLYDFMKLIPSRVDKTPGTLHTDLSINSTIKNYIISKNYNITNKSFVTPTSVIINNGEPIIGYVDTSKEISIEFVPEGATYTNIEIISTNKEIAYTENNTIYFKNVGNCEIMVVNKLDGKLLGTTEVTSNSYIEVESVTIKNGDLTIYAGDTITIEFEVLPEVNSSVGYELVSSDNSILTYLGDNQFKAVKKGEATITLTILDGRVGKTNKTTSMNVTALAPELTGLSINIESEENGKYYAGSSYKLTYNRIPEESEPVSITWSTDADSSVAEIIEYEDYAMVNVLNSGTFNITLNCNDSNYIDISDSIEIKSYIAITDLSIKGIPDIIRPNTEYPIYISYAPSNGSLDELEWSNYNINLTNNGENSTLSVTSNGLYNMKVTGKYVDFSKEFIATYDENVVVIKSKSDTNTFTLHNSTIYNDYTKQGQYRHGLYGEWKSFTNDNILNLNEYENGNKATRYIFIKPNLSGYNCFKDLFRDMKEAEWIDFCLIDNEYDTYGRSKILDNMFRGCSSLVSIRSLQNVINSTVISAVGMFSGCALLNYVGYNIFSRATNLKTVSGMFGGCNSLPDLNCIKNWNIFNFIKTDSLFSQCTSLTEIDLSYLKTDDIIDMSGMFYKCNQINKLDISGWNLENDVDLDIIFNLCSSLDLIDAYNSSAITVNKVLQSLVNASLTNYKVRISIFIDELDNELVNSVIANGGIIECTELIVLNYNDPNSRLFSMDFTEYWKYEMSTDKQIWNAVTSDTIVGTTNNIYIRSIEGQTITSLYYMFSDISNLTLFKVFNFDTSNVTNMNSMFQRCTSLTSIDISNFDTSNVTDMAAMFSGCSGLTSLDLSNFDTSNVTNMSYMFYECSSLTSLDLSNFDTSSVNNMSSMFSDCSGLTSLDLSNFDTSNVTGMSGMFSGCKSLTELDLSNFDTSNVTNMSYMFYECSSLTSLDLSNWQNIVKSNSVSMLNSTDSLKTIKLNNMESSLVNTVMESLLQNSPTGYTIYISIPITSLDQTLLSRIEVENVIIVTTAE